MWNSRCNSQTEGTPLGQTVRLTPYPTTFWGGLEKIGRFASFWAKKRPRRRLVQAQEGENPIQPKKAQIGVE